MEEPLCIVNVEKTLFSYLDHGIQDWNRRIEDGKEVNCGLGTKKIKLACCLKQCLKAIMARVKWTF